MRRSGIDTVGEVPWGTHFCQFYETEHDLTETLVPYFREGLTANEFCMWVTSEPLKAEAASAALRAAVPDLDDRIVRGQIEILDYSEWYTKDGGFQADRVLAGWVRKLEGALERGYDGLRLTGNTFWLEPASWNDFSKYEETVNNVIGNYKMLAICTYSLDKCGATEIAEVVSTHQFALVKRRGRVEVIHSSAFRQAEKALRRNCEELNRAQAVAHTGSWRLDLRRNALEWSDEAYRIFGIPKGTVMTYQAFLDAVHPDDREYVDRKWNEAIHGEPYDIEHRICVGDAVKWVREQAELVFDAKGDLQGGFGTVQDVTGRKQAETALARSRDELEKVVEVRTSDLTQTVRTLEGEVRQRLQVQGELESANKLLTVRSQQLRSLANMLAEAEQRERQRMAGLLHDHVQQLLVSAKFRTASFGRMKHKEVRQAAEDIEELLDESLNATRSLMVDLSPPILHEGSLSSSLEWLVRWMGEKHGLSVALTVAEHVPPLLNGLVVFIFEAVRELLFNVVKHAGVKSASVDVRIAKGGSLWIMVRDGGCGFDPVKARRAAELQGYGLFSIAERLGMRGGTLQMESSPGNGSLFTLDIPLDKASLGAAPPPPGVPERRAAPRPAATAAGARIRVLVADDHPTFREGLANLLQQEPDIEICGEAADGREVLERAETLKPAVILMDINMPRMNGIEATRILRGRMPEVAVIGLSMHDEPESMEMMRKAGAAMYLTKSSPSEEIVGAIRTCAKKEKPSRAARHRTGKPSAP